MNKLLRLVKIHFKYLLGKKTIIILCCALFICLIALLFFANAFSGINRITYQDEYYMTYLVNGYFLVNTVTAIFCIYLSSLETDGYQELLIVRTDRWSVIFTRQIALLTCAIFYVFATSFIMIIIGIIFVEKFFLDDLTIKTFAGMLFQGLLLVSLSEMLNVIFKNPFTNFILVILFWINRIMNDGTILNLKLLHYVFPLLNFHWEGQLYYGLIDNGLIYSLAIVGLVLTSTIYHYIYKDLR